MNCHKWVYILEILPAVEGTEAKLVLATLIPTNGNSSTANCRDAHHARIERMNADESQNLRADRIEDKLRGLHSYRTRDLLSIAQYIKKFVILLHGFNQTASTSQHLNEVMATKLFVDHKMLHFLY
jgi:hypothetical protein